MWQEAIDQLQQITVQDDPAGYHQAHNLLATYQDNYGQIKIRQQAEEKAVTTFNRANEQINRLISTSRTTADRDQAIGELQQIIFQLETINNGTTVYPEARQLLNSAKQKQKEWQH